MHKIGTFFYSLERAVSEDRARDIDEAMYKAVNAGICQIDVHSEIANYYDINYLCAAMKKNGMTTASIHCAKPINYESDEGYKQSLEDYKQAAEFAKDMGSSYFMMVPQMPLDFKKRDFIKFRGKARELISELTDYSVSIGLTPTIEDYSVRTSVCGRLEDIKYLLDKNPKLMFTYDSGNFILSGYDELVGAQLFAERTVYVHLKDLVYDEECVEFVSDGIAYDSVALGSGFLRIEKALNILKNGCFKNGTVTIESGMTYNSFEKMINSARYLKEIL